MLASFITGLLALTTLSISSPIPTTKRNTAELYILANCYNNVTSASYASAFWYYPDFLPDYPEPQAVGVINAKKAVVFEGRSISIKTPFRLKTAIPKNASSAAYQDIVASATIGSFAGPAAAIKGTGLAFYSPDTNFNCFYEYAVRDISLLCQFYPDSKEANKMTIEPRGRPMSCSCHSSLMVGWMQKTLAGSEDERAEKKTPGRARGCDLKNKG